MTATLILWSHASAALLFAAAALAQWRRPREGWPGAAFVTALLLSALWALAVAGIGATDLSTRLAEAARNLAWLGFGYALVRRERAGGWSLAAVYLVVAGVVIVTAALALVEAVTTLPAMRAELAGARLVFRMMAAAGALVLVRQLAPTARPVAAALAMLWGGDLLAFTAVYVGGGWTPGLVAARGGAAMAVAMLLVLVAHRRENRAPSLSRIAATRLLIAAGLVGYGGLAAGLTALAGAWGGEQGRALQAGVVTGAAAALLTLGSTSWAGAWAKVKLAKHLFRHRYDYRVEWQRFTDTLGRAGEPLEVRVVAAVANLLDAPAGLLLMGDGAGGNDALFALLATGRIIEFDAARSGLAPADAAVLPASVLDRAQAWALVPLLHGEALVGAVLLDRPPVPRALDWEDFDLLRVAGRQAASYLAEDRAGRALAQAARFEEFNRRFAFILHDIKNLVSQQLLVARNAERHAGNPAFRADMVATLKESAERMTTLLARLSQREPAPGEALASVNCSALAERVARRHRGHHPVTCDLAPAWALGHAQRLEQVLGHLVQNAVEASPTDQAVRLTVAASDGQVTIEVVDHGAGMAAAFVRDELFRPFSSTKPHGFGIGAFEARQLVVAMGGMLEVDSREGEGTRFRVVLPAAPALEKAA